MSKHKDRIPGAVRWFDGEDGWGVIDATEVPGGCFVHFANIVGGGYRNLEDGQEVVFTFEEPGFKQDGFDFRALQVWPGVTPRPGELGSV